MKPKRKNLRNREFYELRHRAGFADLRQLARFCDVCPRTVQNWDRHGAPVAITKLLQLLARDLEWLGPEWRGFRFWGEELLGPEGEHINPGLIRAYPRLERALDYYRTAHQETTRQAPPEPLSQKLRNWLKEKL
jgi:hypothetical protein